MTLASALSAPCDMLSTQTGEQVILGCPYDGVAGIYVWPWRLEENISSRKVPLRTNPEGIRKLEATAQNVYFSCWSDIVAWMKCTEIRGTEPPFRTQIHFRGNDVGTKTRVRLASFQYHPKNGD
jgi:hypothetical protein